MADGWLNGKVVYYRGLLKSCNYHCRYCPFSKNPYSQRQIDQDRAALARFCEQITGYDDVGVMFLPYGEALIHSYYLEQIGRLSRSCRIRFVACQTNLSFDIKKLAGSGILPEKLKLWCSFHPSETSVSAFAAQCERLSTQGFSYSVGAVGEPGQLDAIRELRKRLPEHIYLWINDQDGKQRSYQAAEREAFSAIDPLFGLELEKRTADPDLCRAGLDSFFVDGKGDVYACNISRGLLGNIYSGNLPGLSGRRCRAKACSCYLAYSNRTDIRALDRFGENRPFRIPLPKPEVVRRAVFFDVDGTLTDGDGVIPEATQAAVRQLAGTAGIYLATSLPYREARHRCKAVWSCISGGVFAEGADLRLFEQGYRHVIPLGELSPAVTSGRVREYRAEGVLYKLTVCGTDHSEADFPEYHTVCEDGRMGIVSRQAGKLNGVLHLCSRAGLPPDDVVVVGNSRNDAGMLRAFRHSAAVPGSSSEAMAAASRICGIEQLAEVFMLFATF